MEFDFKKAGRLLLQKKLTYLVGSIVVIALAVIAAAYIFIPVAELVLDEERLELEIDEEALLTVTIKPNFAIFRELNWETSDPQVALVSEHGLVEAVDVGTASITVSTGDGEKKAGCWVWVTGPEFLSWKNGLYDGEQQDDEPHGFGTWTGDNNESYEGQWWQGQKQGYGVYNYSDGSQYAGEWLSDQRSGKGEWQGPEGEKYTGDFREDLRHGEGKWTDASGETYTGTWQEGFIHGTGIYTWPDGTVYEGDFVRGKKEGQGTITWPGGTSFTGQWESDQAIFEFDGAGYKGDLKNGIPHGKGVLTWDNGDRYSGDWVNGEKQGRGSYRYASGDQYSGGFSGGKKHGTGEYNFGRFDIYLPLNGEWENDRLVKYRGIAVEQEIDLNEAIMWKGGVYAGDLKAGKPDGKGLLIEDFYLQYPGYYGEWENGLRHGWGVKLGDINYDSDRYEGEWKYNLKSGQGTMFFSDGSQYEGLWANDKAHGQGTVTLPDGTSISGEWLFGRPGDDMNITRPEAALSLAERSKEAEAMKDKDFYDDPGLQALGLTKEEIILKNGIPKTVFASDGQYAYPDRNVSYYFDEDIVYFIRMSGSREILGIQIGEMSFSAVEEILGPPDWRSECEEYCYDMCQGDSLRYYLGDYKENSAELELELYTYSHKEGAPVRSVRVTWNRYYSW